ncbi:MAG: ATPase inhibitor subunit zeta [Alsobacter sp.]
MDLDQPTAPLPLERALPPGIRPEIARGWCMEEDTRDSAIARRNVLAALWAGRLMRLEGEALSSYAAQVHFSDFAVAGDEDIVSKLVLDLDAHGLTVPTQTVRDLLAACHRQALREQAVTD